MGVGAGWTAVAAPTAAAPITASRARPAKTGPTRIGIPWSPARGSSIEARTNTDWSNNSRINIPGGAAARVTGRIRFLISSTISSVETDPVFIMVSNTEGWPSARTVFCWTTAPSRTWPMSRI